MKRGYAPDASTAPRQLMGRSLAGVAIHAIEWLWVGWIPKGYITLLAGETGAGKSTVLADITARITTGAPWPGEYDCPSNWRRPERVLWLGSEDSIEEMTVPRLLACGANPANVVEIQALCRTASAIPSPCKTILKQSVKCWLMLGMSITARSPCSLLTLSPVICRGKAAQRWT
ncbi:MAG: AAA family ATPase [Novosphingobium sp.]|nr:AAA family ATPase [Novosphingobium sp.]